MGHHEEKNWGLKEEKDHETLNLTPPVKPD